MKDITRPIVVGAVLAAAVGLLWSAPASADQPDPWITTKAKMALLTDAEAPALDINVDTVDGRVTLHGEVDSEAEKARAEKVVREIDGVREVRNLIRVDATPDAEAEAEAEAKVDDDEIETRVKAAMEKDDTLSDSDIEVGSVEAGVVTLEGKARTMTEHRRALEQVRGVPGVAGVRTEVEAPGEMTDAEVWDEDDADRKDAADATRGAGTVARDTWITTATKVRLMANEETPALDINVDTENGEVTLFGTVPSDAAKQAAEAEAKKVNGVKTVRNHLEVVPADMREKVEAKDEELADAVEKQLKERTELEDADIDVEVNNGVARLTGRVDSQSEKLRALTTARGVPGVRSAVDGLEVDAAATDDADSDAKEAPEDAEAQREPAEGNRPASDAFDDDAHNDAGDAPLH